MNKGPEPLRNGESSNRSFMVLGQTKHYGTSQITFKMGDIQVIIEETVGAVQ
ncbi:MAG: hypothetical protein GX038_03960 [Erysipelothrix sp.]|nr:hypothetical protein [Erysipelothrix sp.]